MHVRLALVLVANIVSFWVKTNITVYGNTEIASIVRPASANHNR